MVDSAGPGRDLPVISPAHQMATISATISTATSVCRLALELAPREPTHQTMASVPSSASSSCCHASQTAPAKAGGDVQRRRKPDRDNR
jgi:hypothetical protein